MRSHALPRLLLLGGAAAIAGCGSVQEVVVQTVRDAAKEAIETTVDEAVDGFVDDLAAELDFEGLLDDEALLEDDSELPE